MVVKHYWKYLLLVCLIGCSPVTEKTIDVNTRITCVDSIVYFVGREHYGYYISSVKIDLKTLKPMTCK